MVSCKGGYRLTEAGRPWGDTYHREWPNLYWYYFQRFYGAAHESEAHRRFCERIYGQYLRQENMTELKIKTQGNETQRAA